MAMPTPTMANPSLKVKPRQTMIAQPSNPPPSRLKWSFSYTLPTSSSTQTLPLSLRLRLSSNHAALPISPVLKEHKRFGVNMNSSVFWALSFWDDLLQTDKKNGKYTHQPLWVTKEDNTVTETKDDTKASKREVHKTKRRSGDKLNRKIYAVVIGASVCALVVFVLPKQQASRELLSRSMDAFNGALLACPLTRQLSYESTKTFLYEMLVVAQILISIRHMWYTPNGLQSHGKLRNRKPSKKQSVTFDDVEGVDEAKAELLEIVLCIKGDSRYMQLGAKLPRGVLLAGPPGTGKTLLARAVAGEADVAFFSISASELIEIFAGTGAARVRDIFRVARKRSPAIIFIDEIDAVGGQRGMSFNSERDQTLNQLLTEMDGFETGENVVVIGATNRPGSLDSVLIRPGRFSRKVVVGEPDEEGRRKIFGLYMKEVKMEKEDKDVICDLVASRTPGLVGADLENIAHESVLLAARRGGEFVTKKDVLEAVERATTKICNDDDDDSANEGKSAYLFGQESVHLGGRSMAF